jgi:branched-chain amino acid transport system permease protein
VTRRSAEHRPEIPLIAWLAIAACLLVSVVAKVIPEQYDSYFIDAVATALVLEGIGIVTNRAGLVALCPMSFAGVGAWIVGYLNVHRVPGGLFVWVLAGGICTIPFGLLIGIPALRLRGVNLAVVTVSFAIATDSILAYLNFPGEVQGKSVSRPGLVSTDWGYFNFCWLLFLISAAAIFWVSRRTTVGRAWPAIARSERAVASMGMSVARAKLLGFVISAFLAGIAGGLFVGQIGSATASQFGTVQSLLVFAVAVLVGAGSPLGALLGGALSQAVPQILQTINVSQNVGSIFFAFGAVQALKQGRSASDGWVEGIDALCRRLSRAAHRREVPASTPTAASLGTAPQRALLDRAARTSAPAQGDAMTVAGLGVRYGQVKAIDNLSLTLRDGSVLGLIGPNGAGKSSFVDAVTGFLPFYDGEILVDGRSVDRLAAHERVRVAGVRRTFQTERTIPALSVADYLSLCSRGHVAPAELASMLDICGGLTWQTKISTLDVGTRRLVEIAGALAGRPRVLLLDEPAAGLGIATSARLAAAVREFPAQYGCSVVLIEHDMDVVRACCDDVAVLDFGRLIAAGPMQETLAQEVVADAYLGVDLASTD